MKGKVEMKLKLTKIFYWNFQSDLLFSENKKQKNTKKLAVKQRFEDDIELINYLDNYNHLGKAATSGIYTSHFIVDECVKM